MTGHRPPSRFFTEDGLQPYTFYSPLVRQVIDCTGVVHETCECAGDRRRQTRCESAFWHLAEPLIVTNEELLVVTCLQCIGARRGAP